MNKADHMRTGEIVRKDERARTLAKTRKSGSSLGALSRD